MPAFLTHLFQLFSLRIGQYMPDLVAHHASLSDHAGHQIALFPRQCLD
jgi:hypothetical protein